MDTATSESVRGQLEKILASEGFARNERLCGFLRFVVEQELSGRGDQLKESLVGVEVFGRRPDYDVRQDSVVRTEASRLRARLLEYYANGGATDPLVIELPKGGYKPVFRPVAAPPELPPPPRAARRRSRVWLAAGIACVLFAAAAALGWWRLQYGSVPLTVAVLPLMNLNQDSHSDYFADGLTSEIIRNLSIIDGMVVRSQTSSFAYRGQPRNIREAGNQLSADYILEGSVFREGQKLRIDVQFVRVRDDVAIWSSRFDREFKEVLAIQDEISRGIVNSLRLSLGRGRRRYEISTDAYDLYLRGVSVQLRRGVNGYDQSIEPLEAAVAKDSSFAPAYAALAVAYTFRSGQFDFNIEEQLKRMRAAADEAIRLDPLLPEAHAALAMRYAREAEWQHAEQSFHRAMELNPGEGQPHRHLAFFVLFPLGRISEALEEFRRAEKLDPLGSQTHYEMAFALMAAGRNAEAEAHCEKLSPEWTLKNECLWWAGLRQGRVDQVIAAAERNARRAPQSSDRVVLGCAYARAGRYQDAEAMAEAFNPLFKAHVFACLGDRERAIRALEQTFAVGPFRIGREMETPELAALRADPRVKSIRNKIGLPE